MASHGLTADVAQFRTAWNSVDRITELLALAVDAASSRRLAEMSRETPTHYKWLLAADDAGTRVWLHEFKPARERRGGYVEAVHNHRYGFAAIVLSGGYENVLVDLTFAEATLEISHRAERKRVDVGPGDSYRMSVHGFHGLSALADGTTSVVMEFAAERRESYSVNEHGTHVIRHVPLEERVEELRGRTRAAAGPGARGLAPGANARRGRTAQ